MLPVYPLYTLETRLSGHYTPLILGPAGDIWGSAPVYLQMFIRLKQLGVPDLPLRSQEPPPKS